MKTVCLKLLSWLASLTVNSILVAIRVLKFLSWEDELSNTLVIIVAVAIDVLFLVL